MVEKFQKLLEVGGFPSPPGSATDVLLFSYTIKTFPSKMVHWPHLSCSRLGFSIYRKIFWFCQSSSTEKPKKLEKDKEL
jgi:hypothetical protein